MLNESEIDNTKIKLRARNPPKRQMGPRNIAYEKKTQMYAKISTTLTKFPFRNARLKIMLTIHCHFKYLSSQKSYRSYEEQLNCDFEVKSGLLTDR